MRVVSSNQKRSTGSQTDRTAVPRRLQQSRIEFLLWTGEVGPGRGLSAGPDTSPAAFAQIFVIRMVQRTKLNGNTFASQRDALMAVGDRISDRDDRDTVAEELIDLAEQKLQVARLRRPWAAWQKEVNRRYPAPEEVTV